MDSTRQTTRPDRHLTLTTAVTPVLWGTTYIVATELLPAERPLLAATVRALPAGLLLLGAAIVLAGRTAVPSGTWWWRAPLLGAINISGFFALLFMAADRLPGGIAAVAGALAPFVVAALAVPILRERTSRRVLAAAGIGAAGVVLLVASSAVTLDPAGIAAAIGATVLMSLGTVLSRRWGAPPGHARPATALLALTGWQLTFGGLLLVVPTLLIEGRPPVPTLSNLGGFAYLTLIGTALAYLIWFRGVTRLATARVTMLALLSPVVATGLGWAVLDQSLTSLQIAGAGLVLAAVTAGTARQTSPRPADNRPAGGRLASLATGVGVARGRPGSTVAPTRPSNPSATLVTRDAPGRAQRRTPALARRAAARAFHAPQARTHTTRRTP